MVQGIKAARSPLRASLSDSYKEPLANLEFPSRREGDHNGVWIQHVNFKMDIAYVCFATDLAETRS